MITGPITVARPAAQNVAPGVALPAGPQGLPGPAGPPGPAFTLTTTILGQVFPAYVAGLPKTDPGITGAPWVNGSTLAFSGY